MSKLFSPARIGPYQLSHRVVMAPLTRMRSKPGDIPSDLMVEYYTQRASKSGLIISEATPVSIRGFGYAGAPGIYLDNQIAGWHRVTDAVHAKGGQIFLQLWHVGRQSHTDLQPNGEAPVAPSPIAAEGYAYTKQGEVPFSVPRALALEEIPGIVEEFRAGVCLLKFEPLNFYGVVEDVELRPIRRIMKSRMEDPLELIPTAGSEHGPGSKRRTIGELIEFGLNCIAITGPNLPT